MKIMKKVQLIILLLTISGYVKSQETAFNVYNPTADAVADVNSAVSKANSENKHVFLMIGGNWCRWCKMFHNWSTSNKTIDSLFKADYVLVHVNFSKENKNPEVMKRLDYPQRFGFPVFVILDGSGNRLHTQNTGYLEDGEGYSEKKVAEFLTQWNRHSLQPENYEDKK
jgi:thioredoxin-related protein